MRLMSWLPALLLAGSCEGGETHPCDNGTPTCDSSLLLKFPDQRIEFRLRVSDALGMEVDMDCPNDPATFGDYEVRCGAGALTITTFLAIGDQIEVIYEETSPQTYMVDHQKGSDFCGNECDTGTINLPF